MKFLMMVLKWPDLLLMASIRNKSCFILLYVITSVKLFVPEDGEPVRKVSVSMLIYSTTSSRT